MQKTIDKKIFYARVTPKASKNHIEIQAESENTIFLKVLVTCPPEQGKANEAVLSLISKAFNLPINSLRIQKGHKTRNKTISVIS